MPAFAQRFDPQPFHTDEGGTQHGEAVMTLRGLGLFARRPC